MKKPADFLCQRAALPIALGGLSIRPLTRHPEDEMMMVVVCQRAQHKLKDYRFRSELSIPNVTRSSPPAAQYPGVNGDNFCASPPSRHQSTRSRPLTTSKWRSRLISGRECWRQSAAIHRSLAGIGLPDLFNSKPIAA